VLILKSLELHKNGAEKRSIPRSEPTAAADKKHGPKKQKSQQESWRRESRARNYPVSTINEGEFAVKEKCGNFRGQKGERA
jgi:hypothetical protein